MLTKEYLIERLKEFGIEDSYENVYAKLKVSFGKALSSYDFSDADKNASEIFKEKRVPLLFANCEPYKEAEKLLSAVVENGGKNYIYTHSRNLVWDLLEKWGLKKYFAGGVTADMNFPLKPAPDAALDMLSELGVTAEETAYIGDSDVDVLTAKAFSPALSITVLWGFRDKSELIAVGADTFAENADDILKLITES